MILSFFGVVKYALNNQVENSLLNGIPVLQACSALLCGYVYEARLRRAVPQYMIALYARDIIQITLGFFIFSIGTTLSLVLQMGVIVIPFLFVCFLFSVNLMFLLVDIKAADEILYQLILHAMSTQSQEDGVENGMSVEMYKLAKEFVKERVDESFLINTTSMLIACINIVGMIATFFLNGMSVANKATIILSFVKEVVFAFIVFYYYALFNSKVDKIMQRIGNTYLEAYHPYVNTYHYSVLNPIQFDLLGYRCTIQRFVIKVLSVVISVLMGIVKTTLEGGGGR